MKIAKPNMLKLQRFNFIVLLLLSSTVCAQDVDSTINNLQQLPTKYLTNIDQKVSKYSKRITGKTEKTLIKLSKWESKIHAILLKTSPTTAECLFANKQLTFASLLEHFKKGENLALQYQQTYNKYQDDLSTSLKYISQQKEELNNRIINKAKVTNNKLKQLSSVEDNSEAVSTFIKDRKKQIRQQALQQLGKSRYFTKMNKESYYYIETLQNYKDNFSTSEKSEATVKGILEKIPGFDKFCAGNSQLAGMFASTTSFPNLSSGSSVPIVNGIPSRTALQNFMEVGLPSLNANPLEKLQMPDVKETADAWKEKITNLLAVEKKKELDFTPNNQHSKPFKKRIEYGFDFQFRQSEWNHPTVANIAGKIGYKFNDKISAGVGLNYLLGLGKGWDKLLISNEGLGIRTYLKLKIKKGFDVQGGSEWNHQKFLTFRQLKVEENWQQAALIGVAKNYSLTKKMKGSIQLLYDFLANQHLPASSPVVFRFGYGFN